MRWLLAYWCFYHVGTASWISEGDLWKRMRTAASSKDYPRCPERRHFRGENARKSVEYLEGCGLTKLYDPLLRSRTCEEVMQEVRRWVGFGPWISFKVADMLERLNLASIAFGVGSVYLFESPKKGAERLKSELGSDIREEDLESWAVGEILGKLGKVLAPPRFDRPIGVQEAETILCKWKSHMDGRYEVGEDIHQCRKGLLRFLRSRTSQRLLKAGKVGGLW